MANPENYKQLYNYIRQKLEERDCANRNLLVMVKDLMLVFEEAHLKFHLHKDYSSRQWMIPKINPSIEDELCSRIHAVLAYMDKSYDPNLKLSYDDCLVHIERIQKIKDENYTGENWNKVTILLRSFTLIALIGSIISFSTTLPLFVPITLFALTTIACLGSKFSEQKGYNYLVSSKLNFFKPENIPKPNNPVFTENLVEDESTLAHSVVVK